MGTKRGKVSVYDVRDPPNYKISSGNIQSGHDRPEKPSTDTVQWSPADPGQ